MARLQERQISTNVRLFFAAQRIGLSILKQFSKERAAEKMAIAFMSPSRRKVRAEESAVLGNARIESVTLGGHTHDLYRWGAGPEVLLVHGWGGNAAQMTPLVAALVGEGLSVVAFDAPAHGRAPGKWTNAVEMSKVIVEVAEHVGDLHAVVAHSLGTAAATLALKDGLSVKRAVYLAPPARLTDWVGFFVQAVKVAGIEVEDVQAAIEKIAGVPMEQISPLTHAPNMNIPLWVHHDEDDKECSIEDGEQLVRLWPKAKLSRSSGLGHRRILRDDSVIHGICNFVREGAEVNRLYSRGLRDEAFAVFVDSVSDSFEAA